MLPAGPLVAAEQPVTVRQVAELIDPSASGGSFGYSVALSGDLLAVGAPYGVPGAALVYTGSGGSWKLAAELTAGDSGFGYVGVSIAVSPNVIAVGSQGNKTYYGAVLVFVRPAGGWKGKLTPTAILTAPGELNNMLGQSVALSSDGKTVVAGGPSTGGIGGAYVFVEPEGGWVDTAEPTAALTPASGHEVGRSVAMSGNTIVAGENNSLTIASAYVFVKPAGGWVSTSQPNATLSASDENTVDGFATSVAISGDTIAVGSTFYPNGIGPGAAFVYVEPETGWQDMTQTAELTVGTDSTLELGTSVAVEGNVVLAGAPFDQIGQNYEQGAVFGYVKPASGWANTSQPNGSVTGHDSQAMNKFGQSIAISGNNAVIGVPDYYNGVEEGAVYIFEAR